MSTETIACAIEWKQPWLCVMLLAVGLAHTQKAVLLRFVTTPDL